MIHVLVQTTPYSVEAIMHPPPLVLLISLEQHSHWRNTTDRRLVIENVAINTSGAVYCIAGTADIYFGFYIDIVTMYEMIISILCVLCISF